MLADVEGSATFVIANPAHYALALRYVRAEGGAPVVVAKGQELVALKIRSEASDRQIPVIEQPELARAMYRRVEVGQTIPVEFYRAIAEIVNVFSRGAMTPTHLRRPMRVIVPSRRSGDGSTLIRIGSREE